MNAQTFWLENLKAADAYNHWIISQVLPELGESILEVGCGNGNFTEILVKNCNSIVAVDINPVYVNMAKERLKHQPGLEILNVDITQTRLERKFDTIIMFDVLEHIENDVELLHLLGHYLSERGKIIIKVPALNCLYSPMDKAIGHYRRYNRKTLKRTFKQAGLNVSKIWYFNLVGVLGWWMNGKLLKKVTPPSEQVSIFNTLVPILSFLERLFSPPLGLSLFAVASPQNNE
ncbi:class I SAM-dependent methyltransferase [Kamptonema cortianum]|uniref:Class I SAM-dependent methyltransferase n=1 Tax=Geitlerinema calcuttense NRMC-F 0142 TaxID=2922238 RepID=A0ABT7LYC3_9CYAN|nr:class I SAM-dependent methyltransferase [Geitlerinema calcuttense]MDK3157441.1 class I SAM-dependent methyltransferase [Kamptonema cortianum]MDL5056993.1 class I SAM-dependent methyltransferase [Geitlerinema calcuttense NRMC-F 0142]